MVKIWHEIQWGAINPDRGSSTYGAKWMNLHSKIRLYTSVFGVCTSSSYWNLLKDIYSKQYDNLSNQGRDEG